MATRRWPTGSSAGSSAFSRRRFVLDAAVALGVDVTGPAVPRRDMIAVSTALGWRLIWQGLAVVLENLDMKGEAA